MGLDTMACLPACLGAPALEFLAWGNSVNRGGYLEGWGLPATTPYQASRMAGSCHMLPALWPTGLDCGLYYPTRRVEGSSWAGAPEHDSPDPSLAA